ncbi:hypothetical protein HNR46_001055 [Haloferula luteola]|uniref:Outer membrane beta-barrel protein n=1 Tax=Haloferula luteola TaxID=595692 RepID=A0A840VD94_9BACT|nr:hypothetical protein [Haloferula luteola]MBB5350821.1 hypothetical protein [Haloferula luteola]
MGYLCLLSPHLQAQNLLLSLPSAPSGYSRASSISRISGKLGEDEQGISLSASFSSSYDSNLTHGSDTPGRAAEDDFVISPGVDFTYATVGTRWLAGARAAVSYDEYFDHSDFSGLNYDLAGFVGYTGGKVTASYFTSIGGGKATDIYSSRTTPIEKVIYINKASFRYELSPKTSIVSTFNQNSTFSDTKGYADTSSYNLGVAGLWKFSPLTEIGPGLRYSYRTGENRPDVSAWGPNLNLNYQLSSKVSLRSVFGMDFQIDPSGGDSTFNTAVTLHYEASELWNANLTLFQDTNVNPNIAGAIDEISAIRLGYKRKIRRLTLDLGVSLTTRSTERLSGGGAISSQDFDLMTYDASLTWPLFGDSADLRFATRYQDLKGNTTALSWDGFQTGMGFNWRF